MNKLIHPLLFLLIFYSCSEFSLTQNNFTRAIASTSVDCAKYLKSFYKKQKQDSAVELELSMSGNLMKIITTTDGKLSGLMDDAPLPDWLLIQYKDEISKYSDPKDLPWDVLTPKSKFDLIKYKTTFKETTIFEERRIIGLKIREKIELSFPSETIFLGKKYSKGTQEVDFTNVFGPVEYCCNDEMMAQVSMVELHFRTNFPSGQVSNDAWKFLDLIQVKRNHQHVHVVEKLPKEKLYEQPEVYTALMGDFFRRSNLLAEMFSIYFHNGNISTNATKDVTYFDHLNPQRLFGVTKYFSDVAQRESPKIGDRFKMGWIGMRGSDKYDSPGLWGLEYRAISSHHKPERIKAILNGIQEKMAKQDFGISESKMKSWLSLETNDPKIKQVPLSISDLLYHQNWEDIYTKASPAVKRELDKTSTISSTVEKLNEFGDSRKQLKMLAFNWANDPLFFDSPLKIKKIEAAQVKALEQFRNSTRFYKSNKNDAIKSIMKEFLEDSGLMEEIYNSFGINYKKF